MKATQTPIVFFAGDPVATGFAESFAHPRGRGTGVSTISTELITKRLEYLRKLAPKGHRFFYVMNSSNPLAAPQFAQAQEAAQALGKR